MPTISLLCFLLPVLLLPIPVSLVIETQPPVIATQAPIIETHARMDMQQATGKEEARQPARSQKDRGETDKKQDADKSRADGKSGQTKEAKGKPAEEASSANTLFGGQATSVLQNLLPFHSPYAGPGSLHSRSEAELTQSFTLFAGYRLTRTLEVFVNPEWMLGSGLSKGLGLSGPSNGELHGQGVLRNDPYLARAFLRWRIPTGRSGQVGETPVGRSENLIAGKVPARRVVLTAGKFASSDIFDASRYANDPRTEFLADGLSNNPAVDFPQDTRGYSLGLSAAWVNPEFALRLGSFEMPTAAGGADLAGDLIHNRGDMAEADVYPHVFRHGGATIVRLLAFRNFNHAGRYTDALAQSVQGTPPDVTAVERNGAVKFGYGLSLEQPIADDGKTGAFLRYGWNNGQTETYAFDEADRSLTLGGQLAGTHWHRPNDQVGLGIVLNGLSLAHRLYLQAGGQGLQLGDARLNYSQEQWLETYYSYRARDGVWLSLNYQLINHPGYNADRGPVSIFSLRLHLEIGL